MKSASCANRGRQGQKGRAVVGRRGFLYFCVDPRDKNRSEKACSNCDTKNAAVFGVLQWPRSPALPHTQVGSALEGTLAPCLGHCDNSTGQGDVNLFPQVAGASGIGFIRPHTGCTSVQAD